MSIRFALAVLRIRKGIMKNKGKGNEPVFDHFGIQNHPTEKISAGEHASLLRHSQYSEARK